MIRFIVITVVMTVIGMLFRDVQVTMTNVLGTALVSGAFALLFIEQSDVADQAQVGMEYLEN